MAYRASHQFARIAERKARLIVDMIRGLPCDKSQMHHAVCALFQVRWRLITTPFFPDCRVQCSLCQVFAQEPAHPLQ